MMIQKILFLSFLGGLLMFETSAQDTLKNPAADTSVSRYQLLNADKLGFKKLDSATEINTFVGKVSLLQDNTHFYCDSMALNNRLKTIEAFGNVRIVDSDTVQITSQYLIYYRDKKLAVLKKKVTLTDGKGTLTTDELNYDTRMKIGTYSTGGKVVTGTTVLTSKEATYYADLKDVYFRKNVKMHDPQYDLDADSLLYNTNSQLATFITTTHIRDSSRRTITTKEGFYDLKNKVASFGKRPLIKDPKGMTVVGDKVDFDDRSGKMVVTGNGVYIDTVQNITILSNLMVADNKKNSFFATQHPLMIIKQDNDSTYVTADTLYSARLTDLKDSAYRDLVPSQDSTRPAPPDSSSPRYFQGFHHVRIFSDSLQAVCDSMFYSGKDSVFRLFTNPIVWASKNQVTGDTIYLFTKNKKPERMFVFENSMVINETGKGMYNQVRGNTINGFFVDGSIDHMRAKGSAQSIYYAKDEDSSIVGVNNASGDIIDMQFENKELKKVIFRNDVTGTMYPLRQLPEDKKILRNFVWLEGRRPKTKFELFEEAPAPEKAGPSKEKE
jgi:lipopolysaccharide export system protein LptA